jgi:pyruvate dehydrogenase E2 component (dihydrolipoamide acetyltransferase)
VAKQQVTVPDIGGAEDAEVIELLVAVGDEVEVEQSLLVLESDKASMEIPSTGAGTVVELLVKEGDQLSEGAAILVLEVSDEQAAAPAEPAVEPAAQDVATAGEAAAPAVTAPRPEPVSAAPVAEAITVVVPDIGTDEAVDLIEITVQVGDVVAEGDSLVALESDKASMEVPAPQAGEILKWLVSEGQQVKHGDALLEMRPTAVVATAESSSSAEAPVAASAPAEPATPQPAAPEPAAPQPAATAQGGHKDSAVGSHSRASGASIYAGPAVRKLAREFGVDLAQVSGSGPRGRIVKEDLHAFSRKALSGAQSTAAASASGIPAMPEVDFGRFGEVEVTSRSKLDKLTAANMQRSWLNVPHVTQFDDADITELEVFRASLKAEAESRGSKLTPMPFILKACAVALRDNPKFNASLAAGGEQLVFKKYINVGMAVDTPAGLVVPVIRDVDKKTLWELAEEIIELAAKARDRKLQPADMQGGCFTVSSLGSIGGNGFTPIVNTPEVGILGVSRAQIKPVWDGEAFQPRKLLPLALSYDHRVINGGDGGRFFDQLVGLLSDVRRLSL